MIAAVHLTVPVARRAAIAYEAAAPSDIHVRAGRCQRNSTATVTCPVTFEDTSTTGLGPGFPPAIFRLPVTVKRRAHGPLLCNDQVNGWEACYHRRSV